MRPPDDYVGRTETRVTATYLAEASSGMDIPLDAVQKRAVVFQQDAVRVPTAALQGTGAGAWLSPGASQDLEVVRIGVGLRGVGHGAVSMCSRKVGVGEVVSLKVVARVSTVDAADGLARNRNNAPRWAVESWLL